MATSGGGPATRPCRRRRGRSDSACGRRRTLPAPPSQSMATITRRHAGGQQAGRWRWQRRREVRERQHERQARSGRSWSPGRPGGTAHTVRTSPRGDQRSETGRSGRAPIGARPARLRVRSESSRRRAPPHASASITPASTGASHGCTNVLSSASTATRGVRFVHSITTPEKSSPAWLPSAVR